MKKETARREVESLDYYLQYHTVDYSEESHTAMMMAMDALSSSEKPNKWIPVSERLPKEDGKCLVTVDEKPFGMPSYTFVCECLYLNGWHLPLAKVVGKRRVVAWMPLPDPYTEVNDGKDTAKV